MPQLATICYIDNGKELLMLHRNKKPNDVHVGKWIGVGGKLEGRLLRSAQRVKSSKKQASKPSQYLKVLSLFQNSHQI